MVFDKILSPYRTLTGEKEKKPAPENQSPTEKASPYNHRLFSGVKSPGQIYSTLFSSPSQKPEEASPRKEAKEAPEKAPAKLEAPAKSTFPLFFVTKILNMMQKDTKLILRSRTSSLIVIFGPLLLIFLVGMAFNTSSLYDLKIGTYSEAYSPLTETLITNLQDQQYTTIRTESRNDCLDGVKLGKYHVCAVFPANMAITESVENLITFYVDRSRMNLAYLISSTIFSKVVTESSKLSLDLTSTPPPPLDTTQAELTTKKPLVTGLITRNNEHALTVQTMSNEISSIDLQFNKTDINFTQVFGEFEGVKSLHNSTAETFDGLEKSIKYLKTGVENLVERFDDVLLLKEESLKDLEGLRGALQTDLQTANDVKITLETLTANIAGLAVKDAETIVSPIKTEIEPVSEKKTHLSTPFPTLLILIIMFVSVLLAATVTIREKLSKAYFRNFITPTNDLLFMLGNYLTNIFLVMIQVSIIVGAAAYFFGGELLPSLLNLSLLLFLISTTFITLGILVGYLFRSEETATLGAISLGSLMLLFSNTVLPIETLPGYISNTVRYNPFVISEDILKKVIFFGADLNVVALSAYMLLCFVVIFFVTAFVARGLTKRSFG